MADSNFTGFSSTGSTFLFPSKPRDLPSRIKYWLNEAKYDCFFEVGPENGPIETIGSIKVLLMGDSTVFRAMLQDSALAEKGNIRITDIEPKTFHNYLICAYGGSESAIPNLNFEEMVKLLYVADKYLASEIAFSVSTHMRTIFFNSLDNFFLVLSNPVCYQKKYLENEVLRNLKFQFKKITMDNKFLELSYTALEWIIQQDCNTVGEIDLWNATLLWAEHKTGSADGKVIREHIFGLLKYFRFLTMKYTEFWENVVACEVLLDEEVLDICKAFGTGEPCRIEYLNSSRDNEESNIKVDSENILSRFMEISSCASFISCSVSGVSTLFTNAEHLSKTYLWEEYLWYIKVIKKKTNNATSSAKKKYALGVFVGCKGKCSLWRCPPINMEISLINLSEKCNLSKKSTGTFSGSNSVCGWSNFQEWDTLLNPENGFIKNGTITLIATIQLRK